MERREGGLCWGLTRVGYRLFQRGFSLAARCLPWRQAEMIARPGAIEEIPKLLLREERARPLVVTGPHLYASGLTGRVLKVLEGAGLDYEVFSQVPPDPTVGAVEAIAEAYRQAGCDCFVAVGGGSPMDGAKGAAARIARPDRAVGQLGGLLKVRRKVPLLLAAPTTAGTGSETTIAAVVTDEDTHRKYAIMDLNLIPRYAVLDPELTAGLSPSLAAYTGLDALTHAVEAYLCRSGATAQTLEWAEVAVREIFAHLEPVCRGEEGMEGRMALLQASYRAGFAFTRSGVGNVHALAHTLGGLYHIQHGLANGVILPVVLEDYGEVVYPKLARLAQAAGLPVDGGEEAQAKGLIQAIRTMNARLGFPAGFPTLREEDFAQMADWAYREANPLYPVPVIYRRERFCRILKKLAHPPPEG